MSRPRSGALALIPARGGSKGFPGKNLAKLGGKSLLRRAIEAAQGAKRVSRVLVTTDSPAIAAEARRAGAEAPFLRPKALATDAAPTLAVVKHALAWLREHEGALPSAVVLLQPTSPLRSSARVDQALALLSRADCAVGVVEASPHPWQCVRFKGGRMSWAVARPKAGVRRQDYPEAWAINGALYAARPETFLSGRLYEGRVAPVVMEAWESVDVDAPEDLALAAYHLSRRRHA